MEGDDDVEGLIARRRSAHPRHGPPGREPAGAGATRRLVVLTLAAVGAATAVLVAVVTAAG